MWQINNTRFILNSCLNTYLRDWVWPLKYKPKKINVKGRTWGIPCVWNYNRSQKAKEVGQMFYPINIKHWHTVLASDIFLAFRTEWELSVSLTVHWHHHKTNARFFYLKTPQNWLPFCRWRNWKWSKTFLKEQKYSFCILLAWQNQANQKS